MGSRKRQTIADLALGVDQPDRPAVGRRDRVAMLTSCGLHAALLVFLACWVLPHVARGRNLLTLSSDDAEQLGLATFVGIEAFEEPAVELQPPKTANVDLFEPASTSVPEIKSLGPEITTDVIPTSLTLPSASSGQSSASSTIEGAVDSVIADVDARLARGDLLVVWLLDASHSLVDDRKRVAQRLRPYYEELVDGRSDSGHQLHSAVASFGANLRERVPPTKFGNRIVSAVEDLPIDRSGSEKVFEAVSECAANYRRSWPDTQVMIVVWTDESGDDVQHLESTIDDCLSENVSVSVVGPSSVLGADSGLHSYTEPKSGSIYQLPVRRGPDSAQAERLELGYWFAQRMRGRRHWQLSWAGGDQLVGMLSGFSPYALTRLAAQTGGRYTIFDRAQDRPPFDPELMRQYQPSYGSVDEYEQTLRDHPLRLAVLRAVEQTRGKNLDEPPTMLFIKRTGDRPFDFMRYYYPPDQFLARLRSSRSRLKGQALRSARVVEKALRHVSEDESLETGLIELFKYEQSPRWRAWYDLTRGRLLATSARLEEYRLVLDEAVRPGELASTTNHIILVPSQEIRGDEKYRRRAEEAEFLLRRCVEQHRGTPWEVLAQRELDVAIGLSIREMSLTMQPGGPAPRSPVLPRF